MHCAVLKGVQVYVVPDTAKMERRRVSNLEQGESNCGDMMRDGENEGRERGGNSW